MTDVLFPILVDPPATPGLRFPEGALTWRELRQAAAAVAGEVAGCTRVAIWAEPTLDTAVGVIGALLAGVTVVPLNPGIGSLELDHILNESQPDAILCGRETTLPARLGACVRRDVDAMRAARAALWEATAAQTATTDAPAGDRGDAVSLLPLPAVPDADAPAFVIYTSGTTGLPKGAVLSYRAVAANLDGLATVWQWTARDRLVHALPLFHVHGLVLGTLGAVRVGSPLVHTGRFSPEAIVSALNPPATPDGGVADSATGSGVANGGGTMLFGVPTMYHRLAKAAETEPSVADALKRARVLISGSAPLAAQDRETIERLTGQRVIERYGLTETLIVCAMPAGDRRIGVGPAVPGVDVRLVDDAGDVIPMASSAAPSSGAASSAATSSDAPTTATGTNAEAFGEIELRGPSVFSGYLHRPDATARAFHDGWFRTGDTAIRDASGSFRIVGRTALDVIKTGGFKVGAGEVEDALRLHPHVAEVAVTGEPDDDLGQRIVAWVVGHANCTPNPAELEAHVASTLSSHKRPRIVHLLDELPRNAMGKIEKRKLTAALRAAATQ